MIKYNSVFDYLNNQHKTMQLEVNKITKLLTSSGSESLKALADKIDHMCMEKYTPFSVMPMLTKILKNKPTMKSKPKYKDEPELYGIGHFRWDWRAYLLTPNELAHLQKVYDRLNIGSGKHKTYVYE